MTFIVLCWEPFLLLADRTACPRELADWLTVLLLLGGSRGRVGTRDCASKHCAPWVKHRDIPLGLHELLVFGVSLAY